MTCKRTPHPFAFLCLPFLSFPFLSSHTHIQIKPHVFIHSSPQVIHYSQKEHTINLQTHLPETETTTQPQRSIDLLPHRALSQSATMTPQSSYSESSEFNMKTQQSTSKDEEIQSVLKLPSSELEIDAQPEAAGESDNNNNNKKKKNVIVEHAKEATLPVKESSSALLTPLVENKIIRTSPVKTEECQKQTTVMQAVEDSGRERLKRHRVEMAGRVWIPDMWGQEGLLKDWIDCSAFDASLMNSNIMLARAALAQEGRRTSSSRIRIENNC